MLKKLIITLALVATMAAQTKKPKPAPAAGEHKTNTAAAPNETIALKGGKLLTITHGVIENGVVVMQNGRITAIGGPGTAIPSSAVCTARCRTRPAAARASVANSVR